MIQKLTFKIYCLKCPFTLEIKYIGVTSQSLKERLYKHIYEAKSTKRNKNDLKSFWIRDTLKKGKRPIICLIEYAKSKNFAIKEFLWQKTFEKSIVNTKFSVRGNSLVLNRTSESIRRSSESHFRQVVAFNNEKKPLFFNSLKESSKNLNIPITSIIEVLSNRCKSAYGYHFVYRENFSIDYLNNFGNINKKLEKVRIRYNDKVYTIKELSIEKGCSEAYLSLYLNKKRGLFKSKFFRFDDKIEKIIIN